MAAFIVIYMLIYALVHSYLAGSAKSAFKAKMGDRNYFGLYRILYNAFAIISLAPVFWALVQPSAQLWTWPENFYPLLTVIQIIAVIGFGLSLLQTDVLRFAGFKQVWVWVRGQPLPLPDENIQTRGVYALVRHPLYLFAMLSMWFVPSMNANYFAFNASVSAYFIIGAYFEERRLEQIFGSSYQAYKKQVPAFVPFFRFR